MTGLCQDELYVRVDTSSLIGTDVKFFLDDLLHSPYAQHGPALDINAPGTHITGTTRLAALSTCIVGVRAITWDQNLLTKSGTA